jgi:hypothetical protein
MLFMLIQPIMEKLTEKAIVEILKNLDPHSTYISAKDVKEMNEPLSPEILKESESSSIFCVIQSL